MRAVAALFLFGLITCVSATPEITGMETTDVQGCVVSFTPSLTTYTPSTCVVRGAKMLTITGPASSFNTNVKLNTVTMTRPAGTTANAAYDEVRCEVANCKDCVAASDGSSTQCWMVVPNQQTYSGLWGLTVSPSGGTPSTKSILLGAAIPPVVSGTEGCANYTGQRAYNCKNGQTITIWGSNFDSQQRQYNFVKFVSTTYSTSYVPTSVTPECLNPYPASDKQLICNLTYPSSVRGEFAVMVETQGTYGEYGTYLESTVLVNPVTNTSTPTITGTMTATPTSTTTASATATTTRTSTITSTPTRSPTPSSTPTGTATMSQTLTVSRTPSPTRTATATATSSATTSPSGTTTRSATRTATSTATETDTETDTSSPSSTPTSTATPTSTTTHTSTASPTSTRSSTTTRTATPTSTPSSSDTNTLTPSRTASPSVTGTNTLTVIPTATPTATVTATSTTTLSPTETLSGTVSPTETTVPHFSGETLLSFRLHVDYWTEPNVQAFQQALAQFFNLHLQWNPPQNAQAGPSNIEIIRIRMEEDELGHRVPAISVVVWRIKMLGYGFFRRSAEDIVVEAMKPQNAMHLYPMLREVYLDAVDGSMTRERVPNPPHCNICPRNPAASLAFDPKYPRPAPYKCKFTVNRELSPTDADAWDLLDCAVANDNYRIGPLGANIFAD